MFRHTLRFMFRPWPHVSPYTSSHASSHGPMPMASYFVMRPQPRSSPAAEFKRYPEAIQDRARPSGRWDRRRLVVLIRATGLGDDWLSGPDRTTDSGAIRDLDPIERLEPVKKSLLRGILQVDPALTAKISEVRGYCAEMPAIKHSVNHARPGETRHTKEPPMPIELKSAQIHSKNPPKRRYFVSEAALCLRCAILRASEQLARMG